jgi:hypothetical protein
MDKDVVTSGCSALTRDVLDMGDCVSKLYTFVVPTLARPPGMDKTLIAGSLVNAALGPEGHDLHAKGH